MNRKRSNSYKSILLCIALIKITFFKKCARFKKKYYSFISEKLIINICMKKFTVLSFAIMCFVTQLFCAEPDSLIKTTQSHQAPVQYTVDNGTVYNGKKRVSYDEVLFMLKNDPALQTSYIKGMNIKLAGTYCFIGGVTFATVGIVLLGSCINNNYYEYENDHQTSFLFNKYEIATTCCVLGFALAHLSVPISIVGKTMVYNTIKKYNQPASGISQTKKLHYELGLSTQGLTFQLRF